MSAINWKIHDFLYGISDFFLGEHKYNYCVAPPYIKGGVLWFGQTLICTLCKNK